jgi:sugar phosphate isomerase/epimerase
MLAREAPRAHAIAVREAFGFWELFSGLLLQILAARDGIPPDPARCAQFEAIIRTAYPAGVNTVRWLILEAFAACGDWPEVARRAQAVLEDAERSEHLYCLPDIHRLLGQARLALGEAPAGRESFARAFALARANGAAGWIEHWTSRLGMDETPRPADRLLGTSGGFSQCPAD